MSRLGVALLLTVACGFPENPPVEREVTWVDAETEDLARRATVSGARTTDRARRRRRLRR
jgi:hypothetical protein